MLLRHTINNKPVITFFSFLLKNLSIDINIDINATSMTTTTTTTITDRINKTLVPRTIDEQSFNICITLPLLDIPLVGSTDVCISVVLIIPLIEAVPIIVH